MGLVTFDTLKFVRRLKEAGIGAIQAEALAEAFREAQGEANLITRKDLQIELAPISQDLMLVKWMVGLLLAGVTALVLRAFFPG